MYESTADKIENEVEDFFDFLTQLPDTLHNKKMLMVMEDLNAKIDKGRNGDSWDLMVEVKNARGQRLHIFAEEWLF